VDAVAGLAETLREQGHEPVLLPEDAAACGVEDLGVPQARIGAPDLTVALGGDGTIIRAFHVQGETGAPILGVNFGRVGFLSGAEADALHDAVRAALAGDAAEERRMTLEAEVTQDGREVGHYHAINEVFVGRRGGSRVVDLTVIVNDMEVATYTCDGIIVSSPTGSTAYALSAGGPIVSPAVEALVMVPVAPHTLGDRAIVLGPEDRVEIVCPSDRGLDVCVTVDGRTVPCRLALERLKVWRGSRDVTLLKLSGRDFLGVARNKFLDGPRA
jgi:NAD+ kinase